MTTTTLYSKKERFTGLYKSTLRRNRGYLGLFGLLLFIFYPMQYLMEAFRKFDNISMYLPSALGEGTAPALEKMYVHEFCGLGLNYTDVSAFFASVLLLAMPAVLALILNGYMQSKKAADVYHALPVERGTLLGVNAAVAMTMLAVPLVGSNLLIFAVQVAVFGFVPELAGFLLLDTIGWLACMFAIYAITTCVCVCSGTIFDSFVFSGVVLLTIPVICGLTIGLCSAFLYGYRTSEEVLLGLSLLSPVTLMPFRFIHSFWDHTIYMPEPILVRQLVHSNIAIVVYILIALGGMALATYIYRRRSSEVAETTNSKGILQKIVKLSGTMISGICFGFIFYAISYPSSKANFIIWAIIGGFIAYVILEVIMNRGFKTLMRSLPLCAAMLAVMLVIPAGVMIGGFGYETRVPDASQIESVEMNYTGRYGNYSAVVSAVPYNESTQYQETWGYHTVTLLENESIEAVRAFHEYVSREQLAKNGAMIPEDVQPVYYGVTLNYKLKSGKELKRYYGLTSRDALELLIPLETAPEVYRQMNPVFATDSALIYEWRFQDVFGSNIVKQILSKEESAQLLAAMQTDLAAITTDDLLAQKTPVAYVSYSANLPYEGAERTAADGYFAVTDSAQETYKFMQRKGLLAKVEPDLSKCYAVSATLLDTGGSDSRSPFIESNPASDFNALQLEQDRRSLEEEIAWYVNYQEELYGYSDMAYTHVMDRYGYEVRAVFEDPDDIRLLGKNVVGVVKTGVPFVRANFYFEGATDGTSVIIPLDRLPESMQKQFYLEYYMDAKS